jgi:acyl-CoA synthetase (AMP-forming)/AMP-acid ligase II/thioesterase domain-containing protein
MRARAASTLHAAVELRAREQPTSPVVAGPGRTPLDAITLAGVSAGLGVVLRERGIGPSGRVVLVTRNGPVAATAFVALTTSCACAPLNPLYRGPELEFAIDDLGAAAVVVDVGLDSPVRAVAAARGIPVLELESEPDGAAGLFRIDGAALPAAGTPEQPSPDAIALLLHTSGTTSKPKLVPLTHANLVASARNVAATLELVPEDVCLNVMPLFHIHGLVAAVLTPLVAGSSVSCTAGFDGLQFPVQLRESGATWTTAVPTAYHSLLRAVTDRPGEFAGHGLRLLRSSSAALPVPLLEGLQDALGAPVVEAYGMTEAAHQMASNPIPPGRGVPGSVGLAAGPEIAILDEEGRELPPGSLGEISVRGANVFAGYEANPDANAAAFSRTWFRTGDEGWLDDDGYLFLRGRLKELINRGGEKIAPREVDEVLAEHPAVAQVVTFALPDERLGEDVAAAVVLASGATVSERDLQTYAVERLAPFKVPRRIVTVAEIPKGATGKLQRIGLADALGLTAATENDVPAPAPSMLRFELCKLWAEALGIENVDVRDDFFALGGDSLRGAELVARIRDLCGRPELPLIALVRAPTVEQMIEELRSGSQAHEGLLVPFGSQDGAPLFLVHGVLGDIVGFASLAARLGPDRPLVGIRAHGVDTDGAGPETVEEIADAYLAECRRVQPAGPYRIGGFCMGGPIAVEMARSLARDGERVDLLLIDPRVSPPRDVRSLSWTVRRRLQRGDVLHTVLSHNRRVNAAAAETASMPTWDRLARARNAYRPRPIDIPTALVSSSDHVKWGVPPAWWNRYLRGELRRYAIEGRHDFLLHVPAVDNLATAVATALEDMA